MNHRTPAFWIVAGLLLLLPTAASAGVTDLVPYSSPDWRYHQTGHGGVPGFQEPLFDDSSWNVGAAPFSNTPTYCSLPTRNSPWSLNTDLLLRRDVFVPAGTTDVVVGVAIDNDIQVWWNGVDISGGMLATGGCTYRDRFVFSVPSHLVEENNLLAVRGHDYGGSDYFDARVTGDVPEASPPVPELGPMVLTLAGLATIGLFAVRRRA